MRIFEYVALDYFTELVLNGYSRVWSLCHCYRVAVICCVFAELDDWDSVVVLVNMDTAVIIAFHSSCNFRQFCSNIPGRGLADCFGCGCVCFIPPLKIPSELSLMQRTDGSVGGSDR